MVQLTDALRENGEQLRLLTDDELSALVDEGARDEAAGFHCLDCGLDTAELGEYYMVSDDVWAKVAEPKAGMLCIGCLEERLGRRLRPEDFNNSPLICAPNSRRLLSRVFGLDDVPAA